MPTFLRGAQSQKRVGSSLSESWFGSSIAQNRALSLLSCSTCWWMVSLLPCSDPLLVPNFSRLGSFTCQLHADGVVLPADSVLNFQDALDAVSGWGRKCRFTFGISPTKSETMIFGPRSHVPSCAVTLAGTLSLVVDGVVLTHFSLGSVMYGISFHVESPIRPTCRLVLLGSSPNAFAAFRSYVLPSISGDSSCASIRFLPFDRWTVLCASGVAIFSVGLRAHQALRFSSNLFGQTPITSAQSGYCPSLGRAFAMPHGERSPLPAPIFHAALSIPSS